MRRVTRAPLPERNRSRPQRDSRSLRAKAWSAKKPRLLNPSRLLLPLLLLLLLSSPEQPTGMDNGAFKLLESATHRTLHAHNFSRSSSQASLALTDLVSRYLHLALASASRHSSHAGRANITSWDILSALDDMGVTLSELSDYCATEGKELNRYAAHTARRVEDLKEFRSESRVKHAMKLTQLLVSTVGGWSSH
jgi:histone H3/H4